MIHRFTQIEPAPQYYDLGEPQPRHGYSSFIQLMLMCTCSHHLTSIKIMHFHFWYALINSCHSSAAKQSIHDYISLLMKDPAHNTDTQRHECMLITHTLGRIVKAFASVILCQLEYHSQQMNSFVPWSVRGQLHAEQISISYRVVHHELLKSPWLKLILLW